MRHAYNIVRFKVKPGHEQEFLAFHRTAQSLPGLEEGVLVKTGENAYCLVAKWTLDRHQQRIRKLVAHEWIATLLEDLGDGKGVTDLRSPGPVVVELRFLR
ncbi:MAG: DUF718 domain-containing protein [Hyphomicrobiales bacterium]